jgi:hypothetical protein
MSFERPIAEQMPNMTDIKNSVYETGNQINNSATELRQSAESTLGEFSSQRMLSAGQEFLNANSLIAKFAFIIFVLIVFMFLIKMGIMLLGYLLSPATNPYLAYGMLPGNSGLHITQDPANPNSKVVYKSNNKSTGIEFSWSLWLLVTNNQTISGSLNTGDKYLHIFNKGNSTFDEDGNGLANVNNAPGLYLTKTILTDKITKISAVDDGISLVIAMDDISNSAFSNQQSPNLVTIDDLPMNKWFHVILRLENTMLDTYINGVVVNRTAFINTPNQNYYDVWLGQNGGFSGNMSNLQYFPRALSAFEINNIVMYGPNTTPSSLMSGQTGANYPYYISPSWYQSNL